MDASKHLQYWLKGWRFAKSRWHPEQRGLSFYWDWHCEAQIRVLFPHSRFPWSHDNAKIKGFLYLTRKAREIYALIMSMPYLVRKLLLQRTIWYKGWEWVGDTAESDPKWSILRCFVYIKFKQEKGYWFLSFKIFFFTRLFITSISSLVFLIWSLKNL